ncbi:NHS-like protein 3 isoform X2 [Chiloscyllium punctatum]|uniref:NHS-like protein 3 isoform X2 n=1 Tax=Chiloscyllium punctatum TaxID=137246 RepID=UPI003B6412C5
MGIRRRCVRSGWSRELAPTFRHRRPLQPPASFLSELADLIQFATSIFQEAENRAASLQRKVQTLRKKFPGSCRRPVAIRPLPSAVCTGPVASEVDDESKWAVHYKPAQYEHQQENVFIPSTRPPHIEDLHKEAELGLKSLQEQGNLAGCSQQQIGNGCGYAEDTSQHDGDDVSHGEKSGSCAPNDEAWAKTRSLPPPTPDEIRKDSLSPRSGVIPTGTTFKPPQKLQSSFKGPKLKEKRIRRTTIMGLPQHVQQELGFGKGSHASIRAVKVPGDDSAGIVSESRGEGNHCFNIVPHSRARGSLRSVTFTDSSQGATESISTLEIHDQQNWGLIDFSQRPKSLAVPKSSPSSELQNPVMSMSPQATYLSKIIPNAILPSAVDVVMINTSQNCLRTVSRDSLIFTPSPACSRSISLQNYDGRDYASSDAWSQSQSSETIVSNNSTISSQGNVRNHSAEKVREKSCDEHNLTNSVPDFRADTSRWVNACSAQNVSETTEDTPAHNTSNYQTDELKSNGFDNQPLSPAESTSSIVDASDTQSVTSERSISRSLSVRKMKKAPVPPRRIHSLQQKEEELNSKLKDESCVSPEEDDVFSPALSEINRIKPEPCVDSPFAAANTPARHIPVIAKSRIEEMSKGKSNIPPGSTNSPDKSERTMSPSSGYSSQSGTPTMGKDSTSPSPPAGRSKTERSTSLLSPEESLSSSSASISSSISERVDFFSIPPPPSSPAPPPPTVKIAKLPPSLLYSWGPASIPPPPAGPAPSPPTRKPSFLFPAAAHAAPVSKTTSNQAPPVTTTTSNQAPHVTMVTSNRASPVTMAASTQASPVTMATSNQAPPVTMATPNQASPVTTATSKQASPVTTATSNQAPPVTTATSTQASPVTTATSNQASPVTTAVSNQAVLITATIPSSITTLVSNQAPPVTAATAAQAPPATGTFPVAVLSSVSEAVHASSNPVDTSISSAPSTGQQEIIPVATERLSPPPSPPPSHHPPPPPKKGTTTGTSSPPSSSILEPKRLSGFDWPPPPPPLTLSAFPPSTEPLSMPENANVTHQDGQEADFLFPPPPPPSLLTISVQEKRFSAQDLQSVSPTPPPPIPLDKPLENTIPGQPATSEPSSQPLPPPLPTETKQSSGPKPSTSPAAVSMSNHLQQKPFVLPGTLPADSHFSKVITPKPKMSSQDSENKLNVQSSPNQNGSDQGGKPIVTPSLLQMVRLRSVQMNTYMPGGLDSQHQVTKIQPDLKPPAKTNVTAPSKPARKSLTHRLSSSSDSESSIKPNSSHSGKKPTAGEVHGQSTFKPPDDGAPQKSPASTASFILSKNVSPKKLIFETPRSPEAEAEVKRNFVAELNSVSERITSKSESKGPTDAQSKAVSETVSAQKKPGRIPPPVAKKPLFLPNAHRPHVASSNVTETPPAQEMSGSHETTSDTKDEKGDRHNQH